MKIKSALLLSVLCLATTVNAQQINDVPKNDPVYPIIIESVRHGYLPLNSDNLFNADAPVTRKEMSVIIDKLLAGETSSDLTKPQIQELLGLSRSFKTQSQEIEKNQKDLTAAQIKLDDEQKAIHQDISLLTAQLSSANAEIVELRTSMNAQIAELRTSMNAQNGTNDALEKYKKTANDDRNAMWVGIALSLIIGIFK